MPILDYLRHTEINGKEGVAVPGMKDACEFIRIPPFHTGALGFIPGYHVFVHLVRWPGRRTPPDDCELYVSPFSSGDMEHLFRLECLLKDRPGVVNRLVDVVSSLELNIVSEESCMINDGEHHYVELILDWTTTRRLQRPLPTPSGARWRYKYLFERLPITDYRYLILYQEIIGRCSEDLVFDRAYRRTLPALDMRPFTRRRGERSTSEQLWSGRGPGRASFDVLLPLSPSHSNHIRNFTGYPIGQPLPYLVSSDGATRTMRVFFPKFERAQRIVHIAFKHLDIPGALATISQILERAGFNIIQSILRKTQESQSIWEVTLDYLRATVNDKPPPLPYARPRDQWADQWSELLRWFLSTVRSVSADIHDKAALYDVLVVPPSYPKIKIAEDSLDCSTPLFEGPARMASSGLSAHPPHGSPLFHWVPKARGIPLDVTPDRVKADVPQDRRTKKPLVFLSYPARASSHAKMIMENDEMKRMFDFDHYQVADFTNIVATVTHRVQACDYFIGIWHHEEERVAEKYTVSPWMPFEYGIALAAGKESIILHSDRLPDEITRRINPGIAHPAYSDLAFGKTIRDIVYYCRDHWGH